MNNFDESKHPRDDEGKFTFKEGGRESNEALKGRISKESISNLSKETKRCFFDNSARKKEEENYANQLLNILGNNASQTDILYKNIKKLEGKIEKLGGGFKEKLETLKEETAKRLIGNNYNKTLNMLTKLASGKDTAGMLDLAHGINMNDRSYIKDVNHLDNYMCAQNEDDRKYLKKKITEQFKDYGYDINKIKGYNFKENSEPSKRIAQDEYMYKLLKEKEYEIKSGKEISGNFPEKIFGVFFNNNLHNAIGKFDIRNIKFDENGDLRFKIYDTYDFNKNASDFLNKAGSETMEKGELKPFFTVHVIVIKKEDSGKIWK